MRHTETVQKARKYCREAYPVPVRSEWHALRKALGDRFLNRLDYQPGDWVVSVSETG